MDLLSRKKENKKIENNKLMLFFCSEIHLGFFVTCGHDFSTRFSLFFKDFIYLFEKERERDSQREREHKQREWERKKQARSRGAR